LAIADKQRCRVKANVKSHKVQEAHIIETVIFRTLHLLASLMVLFDFRLLFCAGIRNGWRIYRWHLLQRLPCDLWRCLRCSPVRRAFGVSFMSIAGTGSFIRRFSAGVIITLFAGVSVLYGLWGFTVIFGVEFCAVDAFWFF